MGCPREVLLRGLHLQLPGRPQGSQNISNDKIPLSTTAGFLFLLFPHSRAPANGGMGVGGGRSNGVSAGAQAQIEDLTTQVFLNHSIIRCCHFDIC